MEWIATCDKLPSEDGKYLVAFKDYKYIEGKEKIWYVDSGGFYSNGEVWIIGAEVNYKVSHWMPFPEPPKEDNG